MAHTEVGHFFDLDARTRIEPVYTASEAANFLLQAIT